MSDTISAKKTESLFVAGMILDIVPAAMRVIRAELRRSARAELTIPQLRVLSNIYREVSTAGELAEILGVSLPAISKMVDGLVEKGWIIRTFREGNRKQIFLKLTPQGRARYLKFRAAAQKAIAARLGKIEKKGRGTIHDGLAELESWLHRK